MERSGCSGCWSSSSSCPLPSQQVREPLPAHRRTRCFRCMDAWYRCPLVSSFSLSQLSSSYMTSKAMQAKFVKVHGFDDLIKFVCVLCVLVHQSISPTHLLLPAESRFLCRNPPENPLRDSGVVCPFVNNFHFPLRQDLLLIVTAVTVMNILTVGSCSSRRHRS